MQRITIFGKGGIGKSTLSANLAAVYAGRGLKVLLVGCDPKHDTTLALTGGKSIRTVVEQSAFMDSSRPDLSRIVVRGRLGVDGVEAGGPEPGIGCAGRGIGLMISMLEKAGVLDEGRYDVALFDVLGDVVCGGFAAPLRQGFADKVVVVTSEELMSLYAANNIARAIRNYSDNGVALCGLAANLRDPGADPQVVERLAELMGTRVLSFFKRENAVREAEYLNVTVVEHAPESAMARQVSALAGTLLDFDRKTAAVPTPLSDDSFHEFSRRGFAAAEPSRAPEAAAVPAAAPPRADERIEPRREGPPRKGPDVEKAVARQSSLWEGDPGLNSQVWGDPDQWRRFFCDFETRRHARTHLEVSNAVINIWHQDLECTYSTPDFQNTSLPCFFDFPWPRSERSRDEKGRDQAGRDQAGRGRPGPSRERGPGKEERSRADESGGSEDLMTNLKDFDVIHGGGKKLDEAIGSAVGRADGHASAVILHSTCVPTVIGDDAVAMVARWQSKTKVPIVYSNPADNGRCADAGLEIFKKMRTDPEFLSVPKKKNAVNLVGFPEGPGLRELTGLLESCGLAVHACVMPSLDLDVARRYLAAEVQVLYPNAAFETTYRDFFDSLPIHSIKPPAPYGFEGTKRWLEALAGEFGAAPRARTAFSKAVKPLRAAWDDARREAAGRSLAFVVDGPRMRRLTDPSQFWGVPVLGLLREMGFGVEVLCHAPARKREGPLSFFATAEELGTLLREGAFQAAYSEYASDARLARAGKAQFSLDAFELGLAGGLRALERLNGICRWPFLRRYARYAGEA
jgi:nitrogenase iron protein NifH